ncbi:MAG TPA: cytochrome c biogenesis protein/redoxin [Pyrinomonadaceae bacterium]|jgi:cytochrome c-type biogenesis protein|nr:cytochrome c biogenesis protein/redoxin [Pyrinomonadaceae bacterium]
MQGQGVNIVTIFIAFSAGVLSFLSPCVLPLVPGYISLISGVSIDGLKQGTSSKRAVIVNSLAFNAGLSTIFLILGTTAGLVGAAITSNPWVRIIGGIVIILFGLQLIGLLKISTLYKDTRFFSQDKPRGILGSVTLGMAFAAGWTPCIGPILGGIIGLAATSGGWRSGLVLSAFYSAGLAVPFLFTGLGINKFLGFYGKFRRHLHKVEVVSGIILILVGLLVMSGKSTVLTSSTLTRVLPNAEELVVRFQSWWYGNKPAGPGPNGPPATATYQQAPDVEFQTLEGKPFRLKELQGQVVLLNFWATYCIPCRDEIPALNSLQHDLQARGLRIVGASLDDSVDGVNAYQKEVAKFDYQVLLGGSDAKVKFEQSVLPTTYLIDRQGRIRDKIIGARDRATWESAVQPLLNETPATASATN